jgi:hypothetical protein
MSNLERTNLETHVDLCQLRYEQLESRLSIVETKIDCMQRDIVEQHKSMKQTMITTGGSVIVALLGVIATILIKF